MEYNHPTTADYAYDAAKRNALEQRSLLRQVADLTEEVKALRGQDSTTGGAEVTVQELIEALRAMPPELPVVVPGWGDENFAFEVLVEQTDVYGHPCALIAPPEEDE